MATNQCRNADGQRRFHAALVLLSASAASVPAHAQSVREPINELSFTADVRHDDNVARASEDPASLRGLEKSDERLSIGASLRLARPFSRHSVAVDGFVGYDFYRRNTELNRERIALSGDLELNAGFCQLSLLPQFNRRQSDLYDLAFLNLPGIESVRNTETTQVYRAELRCGRALGIRPLAIYERSYGDNSNALRKISDYRSETVGGGLSYTNPVLGTFDLSAERQTMKYPNRPTADGLTGYRQDQIKLASSRNIGAVLTADGYVAYSRVKPQNSAAPGFKGLSWSIGLTAVPITDIQLRAALSQTITPALGNNALYSRSRNWRLAATYQLGPRSAITLSGSRNDRLYRGATPVFGPVLTSDHLDQISGRFDFTPSRRLGLGLEVGHERRNANGTFYDYRNTYVALNTRFTLGT